MRNLQRRNSAARSALPLAVYRRGATHLRPILKVSGHAASCRTTTGTISLACESAALRLELVKWPLP